MSGIVQTYHANGTIKYRGQKLNDKRHGFGEEYNENGDLKYRGLWKRDRIYIPRFPKKYKLIQKNIGKGGQGTISLYKDTKTNELVAVKKYKRQKSGIYQYRNLEHLNHLKICKDCFIQAFGIFQKDDQIYLVMEYLNDFVTLGEVEVFKAERKLICQKIWNQVKLLHDNNIVHCDLKRDNIMVNPHNLKVHLIDFGGAIILSDNPSKKYNFKSFTRSYITLDPEKSHSGKSLKKNDIKITLKILYQFLFQTKKCPSYEKMKETLQEFISME